MTGDTRKAGAVLYVATNGSNAWSGRAPVPNTRRTDGPLADLAGARDAIRALRMNGGLVQPVEVHVRGGTYRMSEPLRLSCGDSGSPACPITYCAYPGETPVISGGRQIADWEPYRDGIMRARLPDVRSGKWHFRQLFYKGRRMVRARWPKRDPRDPLYGGWAFVESPVPEEARLERVVSHPLEIVWRFRTDPGDAGARETWFSPAVADEGWATLRTDQPWAQQGHAGYVGSAWYRLRFTIPEDVQELPHLWLVFPRIVGEAVLYVDGRRAAERTSASTGIDLAGLGEMPFALDLLPHLAPGREHLLALRVESRDPAGGLVKPVRLAGSEEDVPAALLAGREEEPVAFRYQGDQLPARWSRPEQGEVFIVIGASWISDTIPIKSVEHERRTIVLARASCPTSRSLGSATALVAGNRFYVENMLEDLTEPGEWCLDQDTGTVYFRPPDGGSLGRGEVTAPVIGSLVRMIGTPERPVAHVRFRGFTFTQTLSLFPHPGVYYKTPNAGQAFYLENTEECAVENSFFDSVGGDAIRLQNRNVRDRICGNEIAGAGGYGVFIGSFQRGFSRHDTRSGDNPNPPEWHANLHDREPTVRAWPKSEGHLIADNHIHHVGAFEKHACGICLFGVASVDIRIRNNLIHNTARFGIGLLSGFGRVFVEYNDLRYISEETGDTGGITSNRWYTSANDPDLARGLVVRFNRIRDMIGCGAYAARAEPGGGERAGGRLWTPYYTWAIYFDNAPMDTLVYGNICARNTLGGIMISWWGRNVTVENNVFVDSDKSQVCMLFGGRMSGIRIRRNIFAYSNPAADYLRLDLRPDANIGETFEEVDGNLFFPPPGRDISFSGLPGVETGRAGTAEDWRRMGYDLHSVTADPQFVDPKNDNYDLRPGSPAFALGFQPIDTSLIGPRTGSCRGTP